MDSIPSSESGSSRRSFYVMVAQLSGWLSFVAFLLALLNKLDNEEWLFTPADLFQASLYLVLFAIFASMAAVAIRS